MVVLRDFPEKSCLKFGLVSEHDPYIKTPSKSSFAFEVVEDVFYPHFEGGFFHQEVVNIRGD